MSAVQNRETALQNEIVRLYCKFLQNGKLSSPAGQPLVEIYDQDGVTILDSLSAQEESIGIYYVDWFVPQDLTPGHYFDTWTFQWDANSNISTQTMAIDVRTFDAYVNFVRRGVVHNQSNVVVALLNDLKNLFIYEACHIPVYWEQAMRVQQEDTRKRVVNTYYLTLDNGDYSVSKGDVYFSNGQKYTVESISYGATSTSSSSSVDSSSSSSSSSNESDSTNSSYSSVSISSDSSGESSSSSSLDLISSLGESSSSLENSTSSEWSEYIPHTILTVKGYKNPDPNGTLVKVKGSGSGNIVYTSFTVDKGHMTTVYSVAYRNWDRGWKPIVRVNQRIVEDGWYCDYDGKLYFDRLMSPEDVVEVHYRFSCFSEEDLTAFLRFGLMQMNAVPPASQVYSNLDQVPQSWYAPILLGAAIQALKRTLFAMNFQEKRAIYGGAEDNEWAQQAVSIFQNLYSEYSSLFDEAKKDAKSRRLPNIAMNVTPEYTLPGGRCMSSDTCLKGLVENRFFEGTVKDFYDFFVEGKEIDIASHFEGKIVLQKISKIWESGEKNTIEIKTENNVVRLTKEHEIYLPLKDIYIPVSDLRLDDSLLVDSEGQLKTEKIKSLKQWGFEKTFDVEVPNTENLLTNNIVSHNSRWFRYLFKSGA